MYFEQKKLTISVEAGYKAILLTVDGVVLGRRLSELRNAFSLPEGITYPNVESKTAPRHGVHEDDSLNYGPNLFQIDLDMLLTTSARYQC